MIDVHTIGAGGGSIAWIDAGGALRVGPQSAGADPGPVCYGRGGREPTVTDADVVLGYISPDYFLGGRMKLEIEAARAAIEEKVARPLGLDVVEAASGIFRIVNNSMSNAIRHVTIARGQDPRDFALCVFGGAGPIHAGEQAPDLSIKTILVPKAASVLSALGNQLSSFKVTKVRSFIRRADRIELDDLNSVFAEMLALAEDDLGRQEKVRETVSQRYMDIRYQGQTHEVTVPIRSRTRRITDLNLNTALNEFHDRHEQLYSFKRPSQPSEVLNLRLDLIGSRDTVTMRSEPFGSEDPADALVGHREVFFPANRDFVTTPIYRGELVRPGHLISGPAVIEEPDTTIVVYPGQEAMADHYSTYVIEIQ
jgi:N-methylhydantoinase A